MPNRPFKVRDVRKKEQFVVDDVYLNGFARMFRPAVSLVYFALCRRVNADQEAYPSEKKLAFDTGLSERHVRRSIQVLERSRIIFRERVRGVGKRWDHTVYVLTDKSLWVPPDTMSGSGHRTKATGHRVPTKDSHTEGFINNLYRTQTTGGSPDHYVKRKALTETLFKPVHAYDKK